MFRAFLFSLLLLITLLPEASFAQVGGDKPTEILPTENEPPTNSIFEDAIPPVIEVPPRSDGSDAVGTNMFVIGAVQIERSSLLSQADFSASIEPFIGRKAESAELQALARAVADRARAKGYLFASALVPAQSVKMGVIRVRLDEGTIDQVKVKGTGNRYIIRILQALVGRPGKRSEVEHALLQISDMYGFSVDRTSFQRKNAKGVLTVEISSTSHQMHATVDNYGRSSSGPIRARLEVERAGVFGSSDWLHAQVLTTPADPQKLIFTSTRYSNMFTNDGKVISIAGGAGKTRYIDSQTGDRSQSRSRYVSARLSAPVTRTNALSVWLNLEGEFLSVDRTFTGSLPRHDDIATVTMSANGRGRFAGGRLSGGISATQGLDILGATLSNDPSASRLDASGQFTKGELWLSWNRKLGGDFSLRTMINGQVASRPLLSSQEIDVGGPRIGRGFNYSERSGDQGITGLAELRRYFDQPAKQISWAQLYAFADGGYVDNLRGGRGGGSLMSAGAGLRAGIGKAELALELAVPVIGSRGDNSRRLPQINAAISFSF